MEQLLSLATINESIEKGVEYLAEHQLANGEFVSYFSPDEVMQQWCVPDSVTFVTGLIGNCLLPIADRKNVTELLDKATRFLQYQVMRGGVWQYFTKWHKFFNFLPPDADSTAIISSFLKKRGVEINNMPMLLTNRNKDGLFYTWFTLHPTFLQFTKTYWRLILRELKHPFGSIFFWIKNEHSRNDIDAVVNANVVYYLGYGDDTKAAIKYIVDIIYSKKEDTGDKWYLHPVVFYYFCARLFPLEIDPLHKMRGCLIEKINKTVDKDTDLYAAMALAALVRLQYAGEEIHTLAKKLTDIQSTAGHWKRHLLYFGGPKKAIGWGCEELTTAFCIEALHLYKEKITATSS